MVDTPRKKKSGLMGGLLLLLLGALFLSYNLGWVEDVWDLIARYWPLLLILMGAVKILEFFLGTSGRILGFGEVLLILFIIAFGFVASKLPFRLRLPIGDRHVSVQEYYGTSFTFSDEKSFPVGATPHLRVTNADGDVTLLSGVDGQVRIKLRKVVYARNEPAAKEVADRLRLNIQEEASAYQITTNRAAFAGRETRFQCHLEIAVPASVRLDVQNTNGDVSLENLKGSQSVSTTYGRLTVTRLQGGLSAINKYGETRVDEIQGDVKIEGLHGDITASNIAGTLEVINSYSRIDVSDIQGRATLQNSYGSVVAANLKSGASIVAPGSSVRVDGVEGDLSVQSSHKEVSIENVSARVTIDHQYGSLRVSNLGGDVDVKALYTKISGGRLKAALLINGNTAEVDLEDLRGSTTITTRYKPVTLVDFKGSVQVANENAPVALQAASPPQFPITVSTSYGPLTLTLPRASSLELDVRTQKGEIRTDFAGLSVQQEPPDQRVLRGRVGAAGGPQVKLSNRFSNIDINQAGRSTN